MNNDRKNRIDLLDYKMLEDAAQCLKVMAHPARLRAVKVLMQGDFAVHQLARLCDLKPHQMCEHLRLMQRHGLLASTRHGQAVYYKIASPRLCGLIECICEQEK